jgi:hypothetical protein
MVEPVYSKASTLSCNQLVSINGWTFLSRNTAGWTKNSICFKSSAIDNYWAEWCLVPTDNGEEYQLHVYNYQQNEDSLKIKKKVDCMGEVMRCVIS